MKVSDSIFHVNDYPLKDSVILDSGASLHVFNNRERFSNFRVAPSGDCVLTGDGKLPILGYGEVKIETTNPVGKKGTLKLPDVAYCRDMPTNLVSVIKLADKGIFWDTQPTQSGKTTLRLRNGRVICVLTRRYNQFVIENPPSDSDAEYRASFFQYPSRHKHNSWTPRPSRRADSETWHLRLGHPGPAGVEHLVRSTTGAKVKGVPMTKCDACAEGKMKRQIRRFPRDLSEYNAGEKLGIDFHEFEEDKEHFSNLLLINDRVSGYMWDYYLRDRKADTIITALKSHIGFLQRQYGISVKAIESDNEIVSIKGRVKDFLDSQFIRTENSPPYTQALNGAAEHSGGVVKEKINAMRGGAKLPEALWREICRTAVYLLNRTPRYQFQWKTPYEMFYSRPGKEPKKPDISHLKVFGCKTYAMTTEALKKEKRLKRFNPKAWIGFLVGYGSSNTYRIWSPAMNKVMTMRDVIFDEEITFDGKLETMVDDVKEMSLEDIANYLREFTISDERPTPVISNIDDLFDRDTTIDLDVNSTLTEPDGHESRESTSKPVENSGEKILPTPPPTPPAVMMAVAMFGSVITLRKGDASEKKPCKGITESECLSKGTVANGRPSKGTVECARPTQTLCGGATARCATHSVPTSITSGTNARRRGISGVPRTVATPPRCGNLARAQSITAGDPKSQSLNAGD